MCYYCHTLGIHPGAPSHRGKRCRSPRNTHSKFHEVACRKPPCQYGSACYRKNPAHLAKYDHSGGARVAGGQVVAVAGGQVTAPTVSGTLRGEMRTLSGNHTIQPNELDASRGAWIWDGSKWYRVTMTIRCDHTLQVFWVDGPQGTSEKYHDFAI